MAARFRSGFCSHPDCQGKKETLLANATRKLCYRHNAERLTKGKEKKKPKKYFRKKSGEGELFLSIWSVRPHICTNCGMFLGDEPRAHYFAHIIPKSRGEKYRLDPNNIQILCFLCHHAFDHGTREQFEARAKGFQS